MVFAADVIGVVVATGVVGVGVDVVALLVVGVVVAVDVAGVVVVAGVLLVPGWCPAL